MRIRGLSSYAFQHHGADAAFYNAVFDMETEMMSRALLVSGKWEAPAEFHDIYGGRWFQAGNAYGFTIEHAYEKLLEGRN